MRFICWKIVLRNKDISDFNEVEPDQRMPQKSLEQQKNFYNLRHECSDHWYERSLGNRN